MPITNGTGTFNIGRDCTIVLMGPYGEVTIPNVMGFDPKQDTASIKVDTLAGVQMQAELPKGWSFSMEVERGDATVDTLFARIEDDWHTSGIIKASTLYQYINEADGSRTVWQYDNVALKLDDPGSWKGDASVKQRISGMANRRRRV